MTWGIGLLNGHMLDLDGVGPVCLSREELLELYETELRWRRQTSEPWSVAAHACVVASVLANMGALPIVRLAGLVHDLEEGITGDVPAPIRDRLWVERPGSEPIPFDAFATALRWRCVHALEIPRADEVARLTDDRLVRCADALARNAEAHVLCHRDLAERLPRPPLVRHLPHAIAAVRARLPVSRGEVAARLECLVDAVQKSDS